jgi:hypothetical protein
MAEQLDLTVPVTPPQVANYRVNSKLFNTDRKLVQFGLVDNTGKRLFFEYVGPVAIQMINALNKANLTNNSLDKRILERLVADGKLIGTVSGSPA